MLVSISAHLTEPPSRVTCFRDVTLYSTCFLGNENLLECEPSCQDLYWKWLKQYGAWDFITDIVAPNYPVDISIREEGGSITVPRLGCRNLSFVISKLTHYSA